MEGIVEASRIPWNDEAATRRNHHDTPRRLWHAVDDSMAACRGYNRDTCPGLARARRLEKVRDDIWKLSPPSQLRAAAGSRQNLLADSTRETSPTTPKFSLHPL